jgi:hypothetical protein
MTMAAAVAVAVGTCLLAPRQLQTKLGGRSSVTSLKRNQDLTTNTQWLELAVKRVQQQQQQQQQQAHWRRA